VVVNELVRLKAPRVVIVACDPSTLARDLSGLLAGGYQIARMALVDLFPQTYHMETVVELRVA
jgi:23S rRNA (uracil1939-C5)-methyltransferase